jgi:hypothetical protein
LAWRARSSRRAAVDAFDALHAAVAELAAANQPNGPSGSGVSIVLLGDGRVDSGESLAATAARRAQAVGGDRICFWLASNEPIGADVPDRLAAALDAEPGAVAATAHLVHPVRPLLHATPHDGRTRQLGIDVAVEDDAPVLVARGAGAPVRISDEPVHVPGATAAALLVDRAAYEAVGGLPDFPDIDVAAFELCRRLRASGAGVLAVPSAVVVDPRPVPTISSLTRPIPATSRAWAQLVDDAGSALMREAAPLAHDTLRIAITVAAPNEKVAPRWGDWHLAQAFAGALRECGQVVRVQTADHADDRAGRACDVHCVVRGLAPVRRTRGQRHVLWIISHPEVIEVAELDAADLVLVASDRFAAELRTRTRTPVESFLQATDTSRFRPLPPDPAHVHDVTVVAKSRDQYRTAVADAIAGGLRPSIYGSGWDGIVDPALLVSDYVDNADLARVYSSAGVVLNDHWSTMRDWGFVSNRIFDALACGAPVISDRLPEIADLFGDTVPTFGDPEQLRGVVDEILADPDAARARARRGMEIVIARHTFAHRAREFLDALARHGLDQHP